MSSFTLNFSLKRLSEPRLAHHHQNHTRKCLDAFQIQVELDDLLYTVSLEVEFRLHQENAMIVVDKLK